MAGWQLYGEALNDGRKMFLSDEQFGQWLVRSNLEHTVDRKDRAAAMWAAEDRKRFYWTRKANPRVRTVRGLHDKWKEAGKPSPEPERRAATIDEIRVV